MLRGVEGEFLRCVRSGALNGALRCPPLAVNLSPASIALFSTSLFRHGLNRYRPQSRLLALRKVRETVVFCFVSSTATASNHCQLESGTSKRQMTVHLSRQSLNNSPELGLLLTSR